MTKVLDIKYEQNPNRTMPFGGLARKYVVTAIGENGLVGIVKANDKTQGKIEAIQDLQRKTQERHQKNQAKKGR